MKKKMKKKLTVLALCAALTLMSFGGCAPDSSPFQEDSFTLSSTGQSESTIMHKAELRETGGYSAHESVRISLEGSTASADGPGCLISGSAVTITAAGTYILSGSLEGQIVVDAKGETVRLVLDGAEISCPDSSPVYIRKAKQACITLADGSVNTLTDGAKYVYDDAGKEEPNAALFSKADLIMDGGGSLTVNANFDNGIQSKDTLEIHSGTYTVNAVSHGITGRDSLSIGGGSFTVTAGGDGIRSNNSDSSDTGWISILGGSFVINAEQDGIQAESTLHIGGGDYDITTRGDSSGSSKAVKAGSDILIENGTISADAADDALHSNGSLSITGGSIAVSSGGDGIHADSVLSISGGSVVVSDSLEGIEGLRVSISGGTTDITASDDGINSAGGSDSENGNAGFNMFAADENCDVSISGGCVTVNAAGDGIDSNGYINLSGGTLAVNGPTNNSNSPLDYNGECVITGGTAAVAGSSGMVQGGSQSSSQGNMLLCFTQTIKGGTLVSLTDESGNTVCAFAPAEDFSSILFTCPAMKEGNSYTLWLGGSCSGQPDGGIYTSGMLSDATEVTVVTMSQTSTYYGRGGFGGPGGAPPDAPHAGGPGGAPPDAPHAGGPGRG